MAKYEKKWEVICLAYRKHMQHFMRYRKILRVFVKHGLGYLLIRLGLGRQMAPQHLPEATAVVWEPDRIMADKLSKAFIELGPTFIKLGQILSTRPDVLPPAFIEEFEKLQDKVPSFPYEEVVQQLVRELGHPDEIFAEFDPEPLAAASIGQVHKGKLKTGEKVIVKVQRPNIEKTVENDLEILVELAHLSELRSAEARRIGIAAMIEEFARMIIRELDYDREARNTEKFLQDFANDKQVLIPRIYWQYTTRRVLTEDYIEGVKLSDLAEIDRRGWDRTKTSLMGCRAFLTQIVLHGFFQADPHPGNILVVDEDHIAFIDFGEVSALSRRRLTNLGELLLSLSRKDLDMAMSTMEDMGIITEPLLIENFQEELAELVDLVSTSRIGNVNLDRIRKDFLDMAYRYQLKVPSYLTSLMKALITVEGVGKRLDPNFNFMEVAQPMAQQVLQDRIKPQNVYGYLRRRYFQDIRPVLKLPSNLNKVLQTTERGRLKLNMEISFSKTAKRSIHKMVDRLSASLIIAGGLVSSALIIQSSEAEILFSHTSIGTIGFIISLIALVMFFISFFRD